MAKFASVQKLEEQLWKGAVWVGRSAACRRISMRVEGMAGNVRPAAALRLEALTPGRTGFASLGHKTLSGIRACVNAGEEESMNARYGMVIDLDRCTGCGSCMVACAAENNVPPPSQATARTGITPMLVRKVSNGMEGGRQREVVHSDHVHALRARDAMREVCPQQAVEVDKATGIVMQMPQRCLGCRYCMTACPYHARYFNWWDPGVACGHGEEPEPGRRGADARGGGEVQYVPRAVACRERKGSGRGKARNRSCRLHSSLRGSLPDGGDPVRQSGGPERSGLRSKRIPPKHSGCWDAWAPSRRFITSRRRHG